MQRRKDGKSSGKPPERATPNTDVLLGLYRTMVLIRSCEEQLVKSYQAGLIHGACHTYIGEEAVAAGVCAHLNPTDPIFSSHRGHGHALAKGVEAREVIAELYGKVTGCSHGRGGSMHLFKPEVGLMGTSGIVGPSILLAAGAAYSFDLRETGQVSVAFFGDGASNNGAFHEGLNLASIWDLPVVFVCENNLYATEVPLAEVAGNPEIADRGAAYGIPGEAVDGNDVLAVFEAAGRALERARSGLGPSLVECKTYRLRPHAEGMPDSGYRTREEISQWKDRCPIRRFRETLSGELARAGRSTDVLEKIDTEVSEIIAGAHAAAEADGWPNPETVHAHLYSGE